MCDLHCKHKSKCNPSARRREQLNKPKWLLFVGHVSLEGRLEHLLAVLIASFTAGQGKRAIELQSFPCYDY